MPARRWPTSCLGSSGMACDDGTVTVSVELAPATARVASEQAARAGVSLGEYVRGLAARGRRERAQTSLGRSQWRWRAWCGSAGSWRTWRVSRPTRTESQRTALGLSARSHRSSSAIRKEKARPTGIRRAGLYWWSKVLGVGSTKNAEDEVAARISTTIEYNRCGHVRKVV